MHDSLISKFSLAILTLGLYVFSEAAVLPQTSFDVAEPILISTLVPLPSDQVIAPPSKISAESPSSGYNPLSAAVKQASTTSSATTWPIDGATLIPTSSTTASTVAASTRGMYQAKFSTSSQTKPAANVEVATAAATSQPLFTATTPAATQAIDTAASPSASSFLSQIPSLKDLIYDSGSAIKVTCKTAAARSLRSTSPISPPAHPSTKLTRTDSPAFSAPSYSIKEITDPPRPPVQAQQTYSVKQITDTPQSYSWPSMSSSESLVPSETTFIDPQSTTVVTVTMTIEITVTVEPTPSAATSAVSARASS